MQCLKQNAKECVGDSMPKNIFNQEIKVIRAVFNKKNSNLLICCKNLLSF